MTQKRRATQIMDIKKLILPVSIILGCLILGGYISSAIKNREASRISQDKKEYIGKRKTECYELLEKERKQFNNATDVKYYEPSDNPFDSSDFNDSCRVEYRDTKTGEVFYKSY